MFFLKTVLLFVILFFAVGVAMALITRLSQTQQRLAELHRQMARNEAEMQRQRMELTRLAAEKEKADSDSLKS